MHKCIDSVLAQSYTNFELILVNDGSTDGSGEICDEYAKIDERVIVIHIENSGVSVARNKGVEKAKGDYITFIDSDDWVDFKYIKQFVECLYHIDYDITFTGYIIENIQSGRKDTFSVQSNNCHIKNDVANLLVKLEEANFINSVWGKLFKRILIVENNLLFDSKISYGEDTLFIWRYLSYVDSIAVNENSGYHYMQFSNTNSLTTKLDYYDNIIYLANSIYKAKMDVVNIYNLSCNSKFKNNISGEFSMISIRAILSMYTFEFKKSKSFRIDKLNQLANDGKVALISENTLFFKVFKLLLRYRSFQLIDVMLKLRGLVVK